MDIVNVLIFCISLFYNIFLGFLEYVIMCDIVFNYIYLNILKVIRLIGVDIKNVFEFFVFYFILKIDGFIIVSFIYIELKL